MSDKLFFGMVISRRLNLVLSADLMHWMYELGIRKYRNHVTEVCKFRKSAIAKFYFLCQRNCYSAYIHGYILYRYLYNMSHGASVGVSSENSNFKKSHIGYKGAVLFGPC